MKNRATYSTEDFKQDVNKLRELIDKCEQLERQITQTYCYKPYRTLQNY